MTQKDAPLSLIRMQWFNKKNQLLTKDAAKMKVNKVICCIKDIQKSKNNLTEMVSYETILIIVSSNHTYHIAQEL